MTSHCFFENSKEVPKWFQEHNQEKSKVPIIDTWTDKGLFRNYNNTYYWYNIEENNGIISYTEIEPQIPSIVLNIEKYTRTYCDSNSFFTYWIDTFEDGESCYCVCSKTPGRLSKYKNKITSQFININDSVADPDIIINITS